MKIKTVLVSLSLIIVTLTTSSFVSDSSLKCAVLHKGKWVWVDPEAVLAHLQHGDIFGGCSY